MGSHKCPYCGFDVKCDLPKTPTKQEVNEGHVSDFDLESTSLGGLLGKMHNDEHLTKNQKESYWRSQTFTSHNWAPRIDNDLTTLICDDCGKTPVELGFWERVDWSKPKTLPVINKSKGWKTFCTGKKAKVIKFPKEEKSEQRQNHKSTRHRRK